MKTWKLLKNQPELWEQYFIREKLIKSVRSFFEEKQFHEVETPLLVGSLPAESHLEVFQTSLLDRNRNAQNAYLLTSPEVPLKKLLVAGIGNCYSLTHSFRNMETQSNLHNPEFTMLEWYHVGVHYETVMEDCEQLVKHIAQDIKGSLQFDYQGETIDLSQQWEHLSISEAFRRYAQVDFNAFFTFEEAKRIATSKGYFVEGETTWEQLYNQIFLNEIEPHLGKTRPTILYEFPSSMAALAKHKEEDPRYALRFEWYINGLELGDCYEELTNAEEQKKRFDEEIEYIRKKGNTLYSYDNDFIDALLEGMPETSGIAVGLDRLIMLFANTTSITDTMFFPVKDLFDLGHSDRL